MLHQQIHVRHAAAHVVVLIAPHHEQLGRRQHGHRHTGIGDPPRQRAQIGDRHGGQLAHVPDRHASAQPVLLGQLAHQMDVHLVRRIAGIEMHVDVHIELARQIEHPMDLPGMIRIVVRRRADHLRAALQSLHQQRVGARIVGQPLLREHAHLDVDRPGVVAPQRLDRLEAAHLHAAVQFQMRAHPRRAVLDALLQRAAGAFVHVLDA